MSQPKFRGGTSEEARKWLTFMDGIMDICDSDWEKMGEFAGKICGRAVDWYNALPAKLTQVWSILRELFVVYWIDCIGDDAFRTKCREILSSKVKMDLVATATAESISYPVYHVIVDELKDPEEIFQVALGKLCTADSPAEKEKVFRVLWDAALAVGSHNCRCGPDQWNKALALGKSQGQQLGFAEGKKCGHAFGFEEGRKSALHELQEDRSDIGISSIPKSVTIGISATPGAVDVVVSTAIEDPLMSASLPSPLNSSLSALSKPSSAAISWADEADPLPAATLIPPSAATLPAARNTAALRSEQPSAPPFESLQHRTHWSHRSRSMQRPMPPPSPYQNSPLITRRHPAGIGPGKPVEIFCVSSPGPAPSFTAPVQPPAQPPVFPIHDQKSMLDWTGDPCLVQLSQLLGDLGWVRLG
ncbi:hypothetical protein BT96DRAFT_1005156 [Gymnopus androsaceus JB14]|uniref:Uncharacterized protein n=1 Tax=Gymnopus androsaceus JB14 TaxID=1447944 RepID=A0A6A4GQE3_9AGAR|nr:hypothetical protein BT96DRAFT_1005156 [Gymnopus androsaceus JB14]